MAVPNKIYKYEPPTLLALSNLSAGRIWFSDPFKFNDPFDCSRDAFQQAIDLEMSEIDAATCIEVIQQMGVPDQILQKVLQQSESTIKQLARNALVKNIGEICDRGVSCFSEKVDDLLMWGHYGQCHQGFCLEFSTAFEPFTGETGLKRVAYSDRLPRFDLRRIAKGDFDNFIEFLLTKPRCWEYECEWRIVHQKREILYHFPRAALTAVYLGARSSNEQDEMIAKIIELMPTKLYKMKVIAPSYQMGFERVTVKFIDYRGESKVE